MMTKAQRVVFALGLSTLFATAWSLTAGSPELTAPDVKADVAKIAAAISGGDKEKAAGLAKEAAGNVELSELMDLMSLRKPNSKKALGVGEKAGAITPDGIEAKLIGLAKMAAAEKGKLKKDADALATMAFSTAAIAHIAKNKAPSKDEGMKKKADWVKWCDEMAEAATAMGTAIKSGNDKEVKTAASKLNSSCNSCHGVFRD